MDKFWISFFTLLVLLKDVTNGQSEVKVQLVVKKYVEKGSSVALQCKHNVKHEILYKVSWFKVGANKFFEYINGRDPPFRNFSLVGAEIDGPNSNEHQVTLKRIDFETAGMYFCEVSTESPIFTKASNEEQLHVILSQTGPPKIATFNKRQLTVGQKLVANCTTSKSRPSPHITWLIDGKKVDEKYIRTLHLYSSSGGKGGHRSKSHQQNNPSYDKIETEMYSKVLIPNRDETYDVNSNSGYEVHPHYGYNYENMYDPDNSRDNNKRDPTTNQDYHDNKYFDNRKHRNSQRKFRRYVSDGLKNIHRPTAAISQLSIDVSNLHPGPSGRLEVTCLATIPAHVDIGEEFADFKTTSVKIDVEAPETTSLVPSRIGASALDAINNNGITIINLNNLTLCLPLLIIFFKYFYCLNNKLKVIIN